MTDIVGAELQDVPWIRNKRYLYLFKIINSSSLRIIYDIKNKILVFLCKYIFLNIPTKNV